MKQGCDSQDGPRAYKEGRPHPCSFTLRDAPAFVQQGARVLQQ
eukprot:gene27796-44875_t